MLDVYSTKGLWFELELVQRKRSYGILDRVFERDLQVSRKGRFPVILRAGCGMKSIGFVWIDELVGVAVDANGPVVERCYQGFVVRNRAEGSVRAIGWAKPRSWGNDE